MSFARELTMLITNAHDQFTLTAQCLPVRALLRKRGYQKSAAGLTDRWQPGQARATEIGRSSAAQIASDIGT